MKKEDRRSKIGDGVPEGAVVITMGELQEALANWREAMDAVLAKGVPVEDLPVPEGYKMVQSDTPSPSSHLPSPGVSPSAAARLLSLAIDPETPPPLLADLIEPCMARALSEPGTFLAELCAFTGAVMSALPRDRLMKCLTSIGDVGNTEWDVIRRNEMAAVIPFVIACVASQRAEDAKVDGRAGV